MIEKKFYCTTGKSRKSLGRVRKREEENNNKTMKKRKRQTPYKKKLRGERKDATRPKVMKGKNSKM